MTRWGRSRFENGFVRVTQLFQSPTLSNTDTQIKMLRAWYLIPEIPFAAYAKCLKPIYEVLEHKNTSKTNPDIFLKTILAAHSGMTVEQWDALEKARLHQKALEMKMGDFHEELLGKFPGYETLPVGHETGTDVRKTDNSGFLEVKNRDNTMNSGSADSVVRKLTALIDQGKSATLVLVNSAKKKLPRFKAPAAVRVINGRQAYTELSGRATFYDDLLKTIDETFKRYPTYVSLLETGAADVPLPVPDSPEPHSQSVCIASPDSP